MILELKVSEWLPSASPKGRWPGADQTSQWCQFLTKPLDLPLRGTPRSLSWECTSDESPLCVKLVTTVLCAANFPTLGHPATSWVWMTITQPLM
jgi:hypothetical protein